jgi:hypothetical protein
MYLSDIKSTIFLVIILHTHKGYFHGHDTTQSRDNGLGQYKCGIFGNLTAMSKNYSISTTNLVKRT